MQRKRRDRDNSGSSEDDNVPITLPLLPLEAPDDASDHSPIILPLKSAEAVKAECRRERKRHRQQAARRRIREERERPRDTEEDRMNRALEEEAMEFFLQLLPRDETVHIAPSGSLTARGDCPYRGAPKASDVPGEAHAGHCS